MTEDSSNFGPSEQAQPTNIPSVGRTKSSSNGSGQAPNLTPPSSKSTPSSQISSSSQGVRLSGASGTNSSSSSDPTTSSSSGATSSCSGYPPSSSTSSSNPEDHPPGNHRGSPSTGEGGERSSQPPHKDSDESFEQSGEGKDQFASSVGEESVDTNDLLTDNCTLKKITQQSSLELPSQTESTQDSFLKRTSDSPSLSSREGRESGYAGGSSSVSVLASVSPSKSTPGSSLSALMSATDSQETLEGSVCCIEDSVALTDMCVPQAQASPASETTSTKSAPRLENEVTVSNELKHTDSSLEEVEQIENKSELNHEGQVNLEVSSELLPLEPLYSPQLLIDNAADSDITNSPVIVFQAQDLPRNKKAPVVEENKEFPLIHLPYLSGREDEIPECTQFVAMEVGVEESQGSQPMDTDMISTQTSFILQLADSQCSIRSVTPTKHSQQKLTEDEKDKKLPEGDGITIAKNIEQKNIFVDSNQPDEVDAESDKQNDNSKSEAPFVARATTDDAMTVTTNQLASKEDGSPLDRPANSKPVPLYESLVCEDSSIQASVSSAKAVAKTAAVSIESHSRLDEGQDTSQITNSGEHDFFMCLFKNATTS